MITIKIGDCRTMLRELPDESVQACVTSPPYWGLRDYGHAEQIGLEDSPAAYVETMRQVFKEVWRVLRSDGTLWLNLGDSYNSPPVGKFNGGSRILQGRDLSAHQAPRIDKTKTSGLKHKDLIGIPWRVALALQSDGWYLRSDIIWHKPSCMPESVTDRPTRCHEYIFLLTKSERYCYDHESIKEPCSESFITDPRWETGPTDRNEKNGYAESGAQNPKRVHRLFNKKVNHQRGDLGASNVGGDGRLTRNKRSVWTVPPASYSESHFATFPPDLIKPCILAGTKPGDVVLDPFAGTFTTGMVALELGRQCIGIELNPKYAELAQQRCNVTPGFKF